MILRTLYIVLLKDDMSADVEFSDYVQYCKSDNQGEITALISTVIPFDILRKRIACKDSADKIGNPLLLDSQIARLTVITFIGLA